MTDDQIKVAILTVQRNQLADQVLDLQVELRKVTEERRRLIEATAATRPQQNEALDS